MHVKCATARNDYIKQWNPSIFSGLKNDIECLSGFLLNSHIFIFFDNISNKKKWTLLLHNNIELYMIYNNFLFNVKIMKRNLLYLLNRKKRFIVRCGVRTHARIRVPELKSGALDHSANLTVVMFNLC